MFESMDHPLAESAGNNGLFRAASSVSSSYGGQGTPPTATKTATRTMPMMINLTDRVGLFFRIAQLGQMMLPWGPTLQNPR